MTQVTDGCIFSNMILARGLLAELPKPPKPYGFALARTGRAEALTMRLRGDRPIAPAAPGFAQNEFRRVRRCGARRRRIGSVKTSQLKPRRPVLKHARGLSPTSRVHP